MFQRIRSLAANLATAPLRRYLTESFRSQRYHPYERPTEYAFALHSIADLFPERVLDVGTGKTAWPAILRNCGLVVTAIDETGNYWGSQGMLNYHYHILKDDILHPKVSGPFDLVTCISTLEHIPEHRTAVRNMFHLLRPGGHLVITVPYREDQYVANVYELPTSSMLPVRYVAQAFSRSEIQLWMSDASANIERQEYYRCWDGDFWHCGKRIIPPVRSSSDQPHDLTLLLFKKP